jgi:hypothetical protein
VKWRVRRNARNCKNMRKITPVDSWSNTKPGLTDGSQAVYQFECSCPSTHMHVSISRLTGTFSHPSRSKISKTPTARQYSTYTRNVSSKYLSISNIRNWLSSTHEGARDKKNPATTIPVFPNHLHVSAQARSREQESAARSWRIRGLHVELRETKGGTSEEEQRACIGRSQTFSFPRTTVVAVKKTVPRHFSFPFYPFYSPWHRWIAGVPIACVPCAGVGHGRWEVRESGMIFFFPAGAEYYSCVLGKREDLPYGLEIPF